MGIAISHFCIHSTLSIFFSCFNATFTMDQSMKDKADQAQDHAQGMMGSMQEKASAATGATKDKTSQASQATMGKAEQAKDQSASMLQQMGEKVMGGVQSAMDAVKRPFAGDANKPQ